jgi:hypothetical protein
LPLARLAPAAGSVVVGLATLDNRGRAADRQVITAMGWTAETRLAIREEHGLIDVTADDHGVFRLTRQGHLRLPAAGRHWCRLMLGDRVLLAADPAGGHLIVYPPAAVTAMISIFYAALLGGDPA